MTIAWPSIVSVYLALRGAAEFCRRVDYRFESRKELLATRAADVGVLWGEYRLGVLSKFLLMAQHEGPRMAVMGLLRNDKFDRTRNWSGGNCRNRQLATTTPKRRFTDNPKAVSSIMRRAA